MCSQTWQDNRLTWNPQQYSNVSLIHVAPENIWKPDIRIFNRFQAKAKQ